MTDEQSGGQEVDTTTKETQRLKGALEGGPQCEVLNEKITNCSQICMSN